MTTATRQRIAWFAWTIVLVSSLVAIRVLNSQATASAHESTGGAPADARFGFRLEESAKALGVDFVHQAPAAREAHPRTEHWAPLYVSLGAAYESGSLENESVIDGFWFGLSKRSWQFA